MMNNPNKYPIEYQRLNTAITRTKTVNWFNSLY